jgi:hypothetical protein
MNALSIYTNHSNSLEFFPRNYWNLMVVTHALKDKVYKNTPYTLEELRNNIWGEILIVSR